MGKQITEGEGIYIEGTVTLILNADGSVSVCDNGEEVRVVGIDEVDTMEKAEALVAEFIEANRKRKETLKQNRAADRAARKAERQAAMLELAAAKKASANPLGHPRRKISDEDVAEIRRLSAEGLSSKDLAVIFPVAGSAIRSILLGNRRAG